MDMLREIETRNLPPIMAEGMTADGWPERRADLVELLAREEYGVSPPPPAQVRVEAVSEDSTAWAGKAIHREVRLSFPTPNGEFSFSAHFVLPRAGRPLPLFVHISFYPYPGGEYMPMEEIADSGWAVAMFCYNDVTEDRDDGFASGLAGMFPRNGGGSDWGKIAMWAWAASRVLDAALNMDEVDCRRIVALGHSRLGKTALWAAAQDERFAAAVSNESGCSGAAVSRGKQGETVQRITTVFPYWFCQNYVRCGGREDELPFDQHQLLASIAPRPVYVASAEQDLWADPASEFLGCVAASQACELLGLRGLVHCGRMAEPGELYHDGRIGYHVRPGTHFLSRQDWRLFMDYLHRHLPPASRA